MSTAQTSSAPPAVHSSVHKIIEESGVGAPSRSAAQFLVQCLENEGVEYVFGIPGEENIRFIDDLKVSKKFALSWRATSRELLLWPICMVALP